MFYLEPMVATRETISINLSKRERNGRKFEVRTYWAARELSSEMGRKRVLGSKDQSLIVKMV